MTDETRPLIFVMSGTDAAELARRLELKSVREVNVDTLLSSAKQGWTYKDEFVGYVMRHYQEGGADLFCRRISMTGKTPELVDFLMSFLNTATDVSLVHGPAFRYPDILTAFKSAADEAGYDVIAASTL